ncbi:MAG TPA: type III secretion system outer membrane ring subunit SctC [Paraburkholderia sp.]|nr:type III secretion system outer membrane ring subunit SctC [Paraburkholderia sp.]
MLLQGTLAYAAEPVWREQTMHYVARDTPLPEVLRDVASAGGLKVKISSGMREPVNGDFDEPPKRVFARLVEAYGLAWYFDGQVIHVSRASDIRSRTVAFAPMKREDVMDLLSNLGLDDGHLPVRYSDTTAIVSGPSEYVDAIADAIAQAQEQVGPTVTQMVVRVFPLRYAQAQDITYTSGNERQVLAGVASVLRRLTDNAPTAVSNPEPTKARGRRRDAHDGIAGLASLRGLGLAGTTAEIDTPMPDPDVVNTVAAPMRRNIVADTRTNSVVVYDVPSMMPIYERTIASLDKPQQLIEITAAVIDLSNDAVTELGIRFSGEATNARRSARAPSALPGALAATQIASGLQMAPGVNLATMIGSSTSYLLARIRALEQKGKARVLSRPRVLTLNNTEAVLSSRNSIYVRVAGNQDVDLYNVDTGLTLKVMPTVESADGAKKNILLSVQIEDGAFDSNKTVDGIPEVSHNSIVTQAVIGDGESLLVGGYEYERNAKSLSRVPLLGSLPFIGSLFRDTKEEKQRMQRLILITPRIRARSIGETGSATPPRAALAPTSGGRASPLPPELLRGSHSGKRGNR